MTTYYTVDRARNLTSGQRCELQTDFAGARIWHTQGRDEESDAIRRTLAMFPDGVSRHGFFYLMGTPITYFIHHNGQDLFPLAIETSHAVEAVFELVRRLSFPDEPSRMQSMFAWPTLAQAREFATECGDDSAPVFEIESDRASVRDMTGLVLGASVAGGIDLAHRYWSGDFFAPARPEAILPLPLTIGALCE